MLRLCLNVIIKIIKNKENIFHIIEIVILIKDGKIYGECFEN
jgi:hypothetical protein